MSFPSGIHLNSNKWRDGELSGSVFYRSINIVRFSLPPRAVWSMTFQWNFSNFPRNHRQRHPLNHHCTAVMPTTQKSVCNRAMMTSQVPLRLGRVNVIHPVPFLVNLKYLDDSPSNIEIFCVLLHLTKYLRHCWESASSSNSVQYSFPCAIHDLSSFVTAFSKSFQENMPAQQFCKAWEHIALSSSF